jgi:hypothetical protein
VPGIAVRLYEREVAYAGGLGSSSSWGLNGLKDGDKGAPQSSCDLFEKHKVSRVENISLSQQLVSKTMKRGRRHRRTLE